MGHAAADPATVAAITPVLSGRTVTVPARPGGAAGAMQRAASAVTGVAMKVAMKVAAGADGAAIPQLTPADWLGDSLEQTAAAVAAWRNGR